MRAARAALDQAQAEERDATTQLKRSQDLLAKGFVSQAAVDTAKWRADRAVAGVANAKAAIGVAEANARNAQVAVDYTLIRAPFDGVIVSKSANVGDMVTPFSSAVDSKGAVVNMADMRHARSRGRRLGVEPRPDQRRAAVRDHARRAARHALSRPHQPDGADGRSREGDRDDQGAVRRDRSAHPAGDERQGGVPVAGGDARRSSGRSSPCQPDALATRAAPTCVFVVRDGKAVEVPRDAAATSIGDLVAITGDVRTGDKAVLKPAADLRPGALVKVAPK